MAQWTAPDRVHVWTHSQGSIFLRTDLALVLKLPAENITVEHLEGAGCYGHNAADDVALDAVLLAQVPPTAGPCGCNGRAKARCRMPHSEPPWRSRSRPISTQRVKSSTGAIRIWSNGHVARPGRAAQPALLAGFELENPFPRMISTNPPQANGGGGDRNAVPLYDFPSWQIESHRLTTMPIRTSALRTLGAQGNVFAIESFLDEIAAERGEDPVAFRLRHLTDERAKDVIRAAAKRAKWKPEKQPGIGHGIAFARYKNTGAYCAVVAEIEGDEDISVRKLTLAVDVGEAINPDGVINQIEGGAIQATSWVLKERVRFDRQRITSTSWTDISDPSLQRGAGRRGRTDPAIGQSIRSAPAKPPMVRSRRRLPTPCSMRSACGCAIFQSRATASSPPWSRPHEQPEHPERRRSAGSGRKPRTRNSRRRPVSILRGSLARLAPWPTNCARARRPTSSF